MVSFHPRGFPEFDTLLDKAKAKAPARSLVSIVRCGRRHRFPGARRRTPHHRRDALRRWRLSTSWTEEIPLVIRPGWNNVLLKRSKGSTAMLIRLSLGALLMSAFVAGSIPLPSAYMVSSIAKLASPTAEARPRMRTLLDRVLGKTMPDSIVKTNGRIEATQVDVAAKYRGRLVDITVERAAKSKRARSSAAYRRPNMKPGSGRHNTT